jgi:uncharacterized protein (DUF2267 family)
MAIASDPYADRDYKDLLDALAREGLPQRTQATRAVEAVTCALAQRVAGIEFETLRELLPEPLRGRLVACERHAALPPRHAFTAEAFYEIVAQDLGRPQDEVEPTVRAVFAAVRAVLPEQEAEDVAVQLPPELQALWRRPS